MKRSMRINVKQNEAKTRKGEMKTLMMKDGTMKVTMLKNIEV